MGGGNPKRDSQREPRFGGELHCYGTGKRARVEETRTAEINDTFSRYQEGLADTIFVRVAFDDIDDAAKASTLDDATKDALELLPGVYHRICESGVFRQESGTGPGPNIEQLFLYKDNVRQ